MTPEFDYPVYDRGTKTWVVREWLEPQSRGWIRHEYETFNAALLFWKES